MKNKNLINLFTTPHQWTLCTTSTQARSPV